MLAIKLISVIMNLKKLTMMWDTPMASIENEIIGIIFNFISITIPCITNWKKSVGITEVSVVWMANDMYFIQWITTSYYQDGYELYRNNFLCIKIACIYSCSHILSWFNWCRKIQLCYDEYLVKLMQQHQLTHSGLVTPYNDRDLGQHWLR